MPEIVFNCPNCSKSLAIDRTAVGLSIDCTDCENRVRVPDSGAPFPCPECGCELCVPRSSPDESCICPGCQQRIAVPDAGKLDEASSGDTRTLRRKAVKASPVMEPLFSDRGTENPDGFEVSQADGAAMSDMSSVVKWMLGVLTVAAICFIGFVYLPGTRDTIAWLNEEVDDGQELLQTLGEGAAPPVVGDARPGVGDGATAGHGDMSKAGSDGPGPGLPAPGLPSGDSDVGGTTAAGGSAAHETVKHETVEHETAAHEAVGHETAAHETTGNETVEHATGDARSDELAETRDMQLLRAKHLAGLSAVARKYDDVDDRLRTHYSNALEALRKARQQRGDLNGWIAARDELKRFELDGAISLGVIAQQPEQLRDLQLKYRKALSDSETKRSEEILTQATNYMGFLERKQKTSTRQGDIDKALAYNSELRRVANSGVLKAARFALADHNTRSVSGGSASSKLETNTVDVARGPDSVGTGGENAEDVPEGVKDVMLVDAGVSDIDARLLPTIHDRGVPPPLEGDDVSTFDLSPLLRTMVGRSVRINGMISVQVSDALVEGTTPLRDASRTDLSSVQTIRLAVRTTGVVRSLSKSTLAVQYFIRNLGKGDEVSPHEAAVDFVALPGLVRRWIFIDMPPFQVRGQRSRFSTKSYHREETHGERFFGVIVSVFDDDANLVVQMYSDSSLRRMGVKKLPVKPGRKLPVRK